VKAVSLLSSKTILEMNCVSVEYRGIHQVVMCVAVTDMLVSRAVACLTEITRRGQKGTTPNLRLFSESLCGVSTPALEHWNLLKHVLLCQ